PRRAPHASDAGSGPLGARATAVFRAADPEPTLLAIAHPHPSRSSEFSHSLSLGMTLFGIPRLAALAQNDKYQSIGSGPGSNNVVVNPGTGGVVQRRARAFPIP